MMATERHPGWGRAPNRDVADLFLAAVDLSRDERERLLERCPDRAVRAEVRVLLDLLPLAMAYFEGKRTDDE